MFVCHVAKDREDGEPWEETGDAVHRAGQQGVPADGSQTGQSVSHSTSSTAPSQNVRNWELLINFYQLLAVDWQRLERINQVLGLMKVRWLPVISFYSTAWMKVLNWKRIIWWVATTMGEWNRYYGIVLMVMWEVTLQGSVSGFFTLLLGMIWSLAASSSLTHHVKQEVNMIPVGGRLWAQTFSQWKINCCKYLEKFFLKREKSISSL